MQFDNLVPLVSTAELSKVKAFYQTHFDFRVTFEHDTYLGLKANGGGDAELGFMSPEPGQPTYGGAGMTLCLRIEDVDAEHHRLKEAGLQMGMPLSNYPWGDRAFTVSDPVGISLYIHKPIPPSGEYAEAAWE